MNLDFAIETCFISGLNAYWKTWLQFLFPFYIWALAGLIVLICRYSTRVTGWFGNNAVSVLATLFLLSYVKLLRILVSIFGVIRVQLYNEDSDGSQWVWFFDGNVQYLGLEHAFLFVTALLILLFLWLPYTAILLAEYRLNRCFNLARLKPLLDSYIGPLKPKHQYWVGLTLLTRVVLAVTTVASQSVNPNISIVLHGLSSASLAIIVVHVYKKLSLSLLELFFLLNFFTLCISFLSTDFPETQVVCVCVSTGISFLAFVGIVIFHIVQPLSKRYLKSRAKDYNNMDSMINGTELEFSGVNAANSDFVTKTVVGFREELLDATYSEK